MRVDLGDPAQARELQEEALRIRSTSLGSEHPLIARSHEHLAELAQSRGYPEEALSHLDQAIAMREGSLGAEDASLVSSLRLRSEIFTALRRSTDAKTDLQRALSLVSVEPVDSSEDRDSILEALTRLEAAAG